MRKLKVVHVSNYDFGLRVHMRNYVLYLRDQGYDISIVCNPGQWLKGDQVTSDGILVKAVRFTHKITPFVDLKSLWQLFWYFRKERFDIVHTHTVKVGLLGRLAARLAGVPVSVYTVHGFHIHEGMSRSERKLFVWIEKIGALFCDSILSQNHEDIDTALREGICPPNKISPIGNGVDLSRFDPRRFGEVDITSIKRGLGVEGGEPVVGLIGRLVEEKGFIEFFEAARVIKDRGIKAEFLAVGPEQEKPSAIPPKCLVKELGLEDEVLFLGVREDIPELMVVMDLIVLPSHGIEGLPRVLMEAAAMGKPAVATNTRGCRDVIQDGETGVLVRMKDAEALASAIMDLLSDKEKAQRMGRAARKRAAMFDERLYFWKTDAEYRRLLRAKLPTLDISALKEIPGEVA
jgi:glycosyltransferase involved in cell wall biosynthesis